MCQNYPFYKKQVLDYHWGTPCFYLLSPLNYLTLTHTKQKMKKKKALRLGFINIFNDTEHIGRKQIHVRVLYDDSSSRSNFVEDYKEMELI